MIMEDNNKSEHMSIQIWALNIDAIFIANLVNGLSSYYKDLQSELNWMLSTFSGSGACLFNTWHYTQLLN